MFDIHPEADPGDYNNENSGDVALYQVEPNTSIQVEFSCQTTVVTYNHIILFSKFMHYSFVLSSLPSLYKVLLL